jgi:hypothetical protein
MWKLPRAMKFRQEYLKENVILVFYFYLFGGGDTDRALYTMHLCLRLLTGIKERNMQVVAGL